MFTVAQKAECVLWYQDYGSPKKVQIQFRKKYGRNKHSPGGKEIKAWSKKFKETGSCLRQPAKRTPTVDRDAIVEDYRENPRQSLRRVANHFGVSHSAVRKALKNVGFKVYRPQVVQALHEDDYGKRVAFAEWVLGKINDSPRFLELLLFSDEAVFHIEGGINRKNSIHWAEDNPHWTIEKSLNSPKVMVWAACGVPGIIGPFFFEGSVDGDSYLKMIRDKFYPEFQALQDSSRLLLMQDGAPPHWAKSVRNWMNVHLPDRWIGRGTANDENVPWPPRSPDLTPMDFFLWGFIKSKVYTRNYENLEDLKASITAAFQEIPSQMINSSVASFERRIRKVIEVRGRHVEN